MVRTFKLLYTGFLPFDTDGDGKKDRNPSGEAALAFQKVGKVEAIGRGGVTLVAKIATRVFDVLWSMKSKSKEPAGGDGGRAQAGAADLLEKAIDDEMPDLVIATGMASTDFKVENVAQDFDGHLYNGAGGRLVTGPFYVASRDNNGRFPVGGREEFAGEGSRATTLPVDRILAAWKAGGVANFVSSQSAGNFICEDVFYRLMRVAAGKSRSGKHHRILRAGFIHTPTADHVTTDRIVEVMTMAIREVLLDAQRDDLDDRLRVPDDYRRGNGRDSRWG